MSASSAPSLGCRITPSMVIVISSTPDSLPASSTETAAMVCSPSGSASGRVRLQSPSSSTTTLPTGSPSTITTTVVPGSPVPSIVGVRSVTVSPSSGAVITGAAGAVVSTVKSFSAGSDCVAGARRSGPLTPCGSPSSSGSVSSERPVAVARPRPPSRPGCRRPRPSTVAPGSAVPTMVGVVSPVEEPLAGEVIDRRQRLRVDHEGHLVGPGLVAGVVGLGRGDGVLTIVQRIGQRQLPVSGAVHRRLADLVAVDLDRHRGPGLTGADDRRGAVVGGRPVIRGR